MEIDPAETGAKLFRKICKGREAERNNADLELSHSAPEVREEVRHRIVAYLEKESQPGGELARKTREVSNTLMWLLYLLARLSEGDAKAMEIVRKNADLSQQEDRWVRYWTLAGLARTNRRDLTSFVRECAGREADPLIKLVALAMMAREGDAAALKEIQSALASRDLSLCWSAMRALRVCYVDDEEIVSRICEIVEAGDNSDLTYDALKAAYHVDRTSERARDAARALIRFVEKWRHFQGRDSMRAIALIGLGKLRIATSAPVLVEELTDENPTIVREAARSLEAVLTTPVAVDRVLEAAAGADGDSIRAFADALRQIGNRAAVATQLSMTMMSGSPDQQERSRQLLSELGGVEALQKLRARRDLMSGYAEFLKSTEDKIQTLFNDSLAEAHRGFRVALYMDMAIFCLGFLLISVSAYLQVKAGQDLATWVGAGVSGATGVLGILYSLLIAKPRKQVTREVDHLMSLKVVFLGYLRQLHQSDQAYTRRILEDNPLTNEELDNFEKQVEAGMQVALNSLAKLQVMD